MPDADDPMENLLQSPDKIVSDCNLIARFPIRPEARAIIADAMLKIVVGEPQQDGGLRQYRARERIAATKALIAMDRLNRDERNDVAGLTGIQNRLALALQVNVDNRGGDDLTRVYQQRIDDALAALEAEAGGGAGDGSPSDREPGGNGNGRPHKPD